MTGEWRSSAQSRSVIHSGCLLRWQARELMSLRLGITCDGFAGHQLRVCEALAACTRLTELKVPGVLRGLRAASCRSQKYGSNAYTLCDGQGDRASASLKPSTAC
jgi:hypothetical protein